MIPLTEMDRALAASRRALAASAALIIALVMGLLYLLVRRVIMAPIGRLKAAAVAIGQGNYDVHNRVQAALLFRQQQDDPG
ncbi:MAG: HAMP domain-containing protein [Chloroflexi bacterium]|nr:MAG: HAMP domain-containing protein [Chloroflexota bacterium]